MPANLVGWIPLNWTGMPEKSSGTRASVDKAVPGLATFEPPEASPRFCSLGFLIRLLQSLLQYCFPTMNSLRFVRPLATKFTSTSLPRIVCPYSAATSSSYEHLLVSSPKPGVTLSMPASLSMAISFDLHISSDTPVSLQSQSTAPKP